MFISRMKTYKHFVLILCFFGFVGTSGCATSSVFKSYTSQANDVIADVKNGNFDNALVELEKKTECNDKILYLMERGRVAQLANRTDESMADFEKAIEAIREQEDKAKISMGDTGASASSIIVNDNAIPYKGNGYEKVFVYQFQSMNYLAKGDLEGAGVEVSRANAQQDWELEQHNKELDEIEKAKKKQCEEKQFDEEELQGGVDQSYQSMYAEASKIKNSFQNAYTYYVTGLIYELRNLPDDALIDYKKALEIYPDNPYLQKDVIRLSKKLGFDDDVELYTNLYPESASALKEEKNEECGDIILLYERGFVPQKKEIGIPMPLYKGIVKTAFPIYGSECDECQCLKVSCDDHLLGKTEVICDVRRLAIKALYEQLPGIITREIARVITKSIVQKTAAENGGILGRIGGVIYGTVTSNADLRAWYSLPHDVQIMRVTVPAGDAPLVLQRANNATPLELTVQVEPESQTIVRVIDVGTSFFADSYTF